MAIAVNNCTQIKINSKKIIALVARFLLAYNLKNTAISIAFISSSEMRKINRQYRGIDSSTDVLSFTDTGEILVDLAYLKTAPKLAGGNLQAEAEFVIVHGLLHLAGYDDRTEKKRLQMITLGKKFIDRKAFSIVEMLVAISIIALVTGVFLASYSSRENHSQLFNSREELVIDLRLTRAYAMGSREYNNLPVAGGWGIYFEKAASSSYLIFPDVNNNYFSVGEDSESKGALRRTLPSGVVIGDISTTDHQNLDSAEVIFSSDGTSAIIYDEDNNATSSALIISLTETSGNATSTLSINFWGLIQKQ